MKNYFTLSLLLFSSTFLSAQHPNIFMNTAEVTAKKIKIDAGEEPWLGAYNIAISTANTALNQSLISVRDGGTNTNGLFDGDFSGGRHDYNAARDMSYAIRDLGIAYAFSNDSSYADKAIELINHWTINPTSRMNPQFTSGQSWIELTITMPAMFYGADMIWNYSGWDPIQKSNFVDWVQDFVNVSINSNTVVPTNNFGDWRLVFLASAAVIIEDTSVMTNVVNHYKNLVPFQIDNNGKLTWEFDRTSPKDGLFYSTFAMAAIAQICEIVRHHGTDLYNWEATNGKGSIEKAFDYMAPFVELPSTWTQPSTPTVPYTYTGENAVVFELAYSIWQKPAYLQTIQAWGRPLTGNYVQGPLTLTHAFGSNSLDISVLQFEDRVIISPNPTSNIFTIDIENNTLNYIYLYNQYGQLLTTEINYNNQINLSSFPNGIYFVKLFLNNGVSITRKVIKN